MSIPFIVSSTAEKADPATRKLIRSYARRGHKTRKANNGGGGGDSDRVAQQQVNYWGTVVKSRHPKPVQLQEVMDMYTMLVPGRVGSDFSFTELPGEIEPSVLVNMTRVSVDAMRIICPLIMALGFQADNQAWLHIIGHDAAALHITAFAMESFIDRILRHKGENDVGRSMNPTAMLHFHKGVRLLREKLAAEDDIDGAKISDATIRSVVKLASATHFNGDHQAATKHMNGIREMVHLRGGLDVFRGQWLRVEILRCDLGIALLSGSTPMFFSHPRDTVNGYPAKLALVFNDAILFSQAEKNSMELSQHLDSAVATAWQIMTRFCRMVNLGTQTQRLLRQDLVHETMTAVMYPLLRMGDNHFSAGSIDEAVRLGLLAYSYHVFLQWQDIKLPMYRYFPSGYRKAIQKFSQEDGLTLSSSSTSSLRLLPSLYFQLMLWLLMTGATAVFTALDEPWLRTSLLDCAKRCRVKTWKEMEDILKSFLWIELLDEQAGKKVYDTLQLGIESDGNWRNRLNEVKGGNGVH